jgi:hypothetical protein
VNRFYFNYYSTPDQTSPKHCGGFVLPSATQPESTSFHASRRLDAVARFSPVVFLFFASALVGGASAWQGFESWLQFN